MNTTIRTALTPAEMYQAVALRDAGYDNRFVYGVITTGICCRPSCASRAARRENLRFFESVGVAIREGFRPCKRCRPQEQVAGFDVLVQLARYIETHAEERLTLAQLGLRAGLSASRLQRVFKQTFGVSPKAYQDECRLQQFKSALHKQANVTDAMHTAGLGSNTRIYTDAAMNLGMTPKQYRAGGDGELIYHAFRPTAMGGLMMAATHKGVCFAQFGNSEAELLSILNTEFPTAVITPSQGLNSPELDDWIAALDNHLSKQQPRPELPLDLRGTAFQIRVWRFLLQSHHGDAYSYSEVAAAIKKPKAVRAAASACAANRIAVLVPCHRVLRSDGGLGGYRWGVARKRALLDLERTQD